MDLQIALQESDRVDVTVDGHTITTHQDGSAPDPFDLFLASLGACTGFYVSRFCRQRDIPVRGISIRQHTLTDPATRMVRRIEFDIRLPADFPERYKEPLCRAAGLCSVKKHLEQPPPVLVRASVAEPSAPAVGQ